MTNHRYILLGLGLSLALAAAAQTNGSNSSYSRFGLGLLSDQTSGYNRSMGGVGQALRSGVRVSKTNPASYSAIDSLTFVFDVGMGLQRTRLVQNSTHTAANNTSFDYVTAAFRLKRRLGMSIGFMPLSSIGYSFSQQRDVTSDPLSAQRITQLVSYDGSGGLHEFYGGLGWEPFRGLSVGFNAGYVWGNIAHQTSQLFAEDGTTNTTSYSSLSTSYSSDVRTWKGEVGAQYQFLLNPLNRFTLGATVGIGHTIHDDATMTRTALSGDTIRRTAPDAFELPMTYSFGLAWEHANRLLVAADATLEQWGRCVTPQLETTPGGADIVYVPRSGTYSDRWRVNAGAEYVPDIYGSYVSRVKYRVGAAYSTPYLNINGLDGPREFSLTAGVGLPVITRYSGRSVVNVGVQWSCRKPSSSALITENTIRLNIGLTFNDAWFMKWKFR